MQQTKRRSKKGVILLALMVALLVMAIAPAVASAALTAPSHIVIISHVRILFAENASILAEIYRHCQFGCRVAGNIRAQVKYHRILSEIGDK